MGTESIWMGVSVFLLGVFYSNGVFRDGAGGDWFSAAWSDVHDMIPDRESTISQNMMFRSSYSCVTLAFPPPVALFRLREKERHKVPIEKTIDIARAGEERPGQKKKKRTSNK